MKPNPFLYAMAMSVLFQFIQGCHTTSVICTTVNAIRFNKVWAQNFKASQ